MKLRTRFEKNSKTNLGFRRRKKSNKLFANWLQRGRGTVFVVGFAVVGLVTLAITLASDPNALISGAQNVVFEYRSEDVDAHTAATAKHADSYAIVFGDGRYYCTDDSPNNPVGIKQGTLGKAALQKLGTDVKATGFMSLQDVYSPSGVAASHLGESFTFQLVGGVKESICNNLPRRQL